jgi:type VI secretion system protein ImpK
MNSNVNLFLQTTNTSIESDEATPILTPSGFYRSRIYNLNTSINPLIAACDPILTLVTNLKNIEYPVDRNKFLEDLAHEIRAFVHRAQLANYQENVITAARYTLCCLVDEKIALTSEWGKNNGWLQNNLLTIFHNESYGGNHFFTIIKNAMENTNLNLHLIELLYLCLSFGFTGKYRDAEHGKSELTSLNNKLYQIICQYRRIEHPDLFVCDSDINLKPKHHHSSIFTLATTNTLKTLGITTVFALALSGLIYLGIKFKLHYISKPLYPLIEQNINVKKQE